MSENSLLSGISTLSLDKDQRIRLVVQSPYTFTETHVTNIEERLTKFSEKTGTECKYLPTKETVRIFANTREELEAARVEVTALFRDQGRVICGKKGDNLCRKYIQVKQKSKRRDKRNEEEESMASPFPVEHSDDESTNKPAEEPILTSSVVFQLDRRIRNFSALFNTYGVEHLPPVVPGAVDKLRDIERATGVQCTIQGRNLICSSTHPAALEDAISRFETLQHVHLNPPPIDPKPDIIIHHDDINMNLRVGIRPITSTRTSQTFAPLPYELRSAYDLVGLDYRPEDPSRKRNWDRRASASSETSSTSTEQKSKEYASVAKETLVPRPVPVFELPGIQRRRKNLSILVNNLRYGLEHARRWRGEVTLEAKLGSIAVVAPNSRQLNEKLDFEQLQDIFSGENPRLRFSDVATTNKTMSEEIICVLIAVGEASGLATPSPVNSYANPGGYTPTVPPTPMSAPKPNPSSVRKQAHFVVTCRARADVNHPWTQAKITLEAGTLKVLSVVPRASTSLADVYWKNLERCWDYRIRLKGRYPAGRADVKPFITFGKKVTFSPQGAGISYHEETGLFEVIGLKHKLMVATPLDAANYREVVISKVTIMSLASEASAANDPQNAKPFFCRPETSITDDAFRRNSDAEDPRNSDRRNGRRNVYENLTTADSDDDDENKQFTNNNGAETGTATGKDDHDTEGDRATNVKTSGLAGDNEDKAKDEPVQIGLDIVLSESEPEAALCHDVILPEFGTESAPIQIYDVVLPEIGTKSAPICVDDDVVNAESGTESAPCRIDDDVVSPETETEPAPCRIDDDVVVPENEVIEPAVPNDSLQVDRNGIPRIHYTVKIQCNRWKKQFQENRTMAVGKIAGWTVDGILNKPVFNSTASTPAAPSVGTGSPIRTWNTTPMNPDAPAFVMSKPATPRPNPNDDLVDFVRSVITVGEHLHHVSKKYGKMSEAANTASTSTIRTIRIVSGTSSGVAGESVVKK